MHAHAQTHAAKHWRAQFPVVSQGFVLKPANVPLRSPTLKALTFLSPIGPPSTLEFKLIVCDSLLEVRLRGLS